jgi:hypothetical protein
MKRTGFAVEQGPDTVYYFGRIVGEQLRQRGNAGAGVLGFIQQINSVMVVTGRTRAAGPAGGLFHKGSLKNSLKESSARILEASLIARNMRA